MGTLQQPVGKTPRSKLKRLLRWTAVTVLLWLVCSYIVAYRLTWRPRAIFAEPAPSVTWGTVEPLRLTAEDGEQLGAWFIPGAAGQPVVLLLHGNNGCRGACLTQAEIAGSIGCPVLMVSLRAHGDSTGDFNDFGWGGRKDVAAAVAWLEKNQPGRPIVVWGQSLGAAAAAFAAEELADRVGGYILECPYQDIRTAVWNRTKIYLPPVLDFIAYAGLRTVAPLVLPNLDQLSVRDAVGKLPPSMPVLILAGGADRHARPEEAVAIRSRIPGPAELVFIEGAEHSQLAAADPDGYRRAVLGFLAKTPRAGF
jgi:pimeloyl-ACP methyl ester carboxylesterase